jgi:hypothetical protein
VKQLHRSNDDHIRQKYVEEVTFMKERQHGTLAVHAQDKKLHLQDCPRKLQPIDTQMELMYFSNTHDVVPISQTLSW